jgi:hypothetical protein
VLVVLALAALAILVGVVVVSMGRGGELSEFPPDMPPLNLPEAGQLSAVDFVSLQLPVSLVGYHTQSVDETLHRAAGAISARDTKIAVLEQRVTELLAGRLQARQEAQANAPALPQRTRMVHRPGGPAKLPDLPEDGAAEPAAAKTTWFSEGAPAPRPLDARPAETKDTWFSEGAPVSPEAGPAADATLNDAGLKDAEPKDTWFSEGALASQEAGPAADAKPQDAESKDTWFSGGAPVAQEVGSADKQAEPKDAEPEDTWFSEGTPASQQAEADPEAKPETKPEEAASGRPDGGSEGQDGGSGAAGRPGGAGAVDGRPRDEGREPGPGTTGDRAGAEESR